MSSTERTRRGCCIAAFLVFFMQAGFMMLEAGFARTREVVNVLQECIVDTCLCALLFWAFGFAFMFGVGNGFIGHQYFFLNGAPATYTYNGAFDTGVAFMAFFLFQFAFADTCSTITSGAMVGRTGFKGDLLYSIGVSGFIYPILGHWVWGPGGWLQTANSGGVLDPRLRRLHRGAHDGRHDRPRRRHRARATSRSQVQARRWWSATGPRHDGRRHRRRHPVVRLVRLQPRQHAVGDRLPRGIGRVATNTTLAAAAAGLTAMALVYPRVKKWDMGITINGFLGGLVAITCPCYWVNATGAVIIGAIAGARRRATASTSSSTSASTIRSVPSRCTASPASGARGPSACSPPVSSACRRVCSGAAAPSSSGSQVWGNAVMGVAAFVVAFVLMRAVKLTGTLRVSEEGELEGIDIHEHGAPAYHPEAAYMGKGL